MLEQNVKHGMLQNCNTSPEIAVHPRFLCRISEVRLERQRKAANTKDKAKDDLISAYCTLNRAVNVLKKHESRFPQKLLGIFLPECESLRCTLLSLSQASAPSDEDIKAARKRLRYLVESIRSFSS